MLVTLLVLLLLAPAVPEPVVVRPAPGAAAGVVAWEPPVVTAPLRPGSGHVARLALRNGSDRPVTVRLRTSDVAAGEGGAPVAEAGGGGEPTWATLPTDRVDLEPDHQATLGLALNVPEDAPPRGRLVAVLAEVEGERPATAVAWVLLEPPGVEPALTTAPLLRAEGGTGIVETRLRNTGDDPAVVRGRVRVRSWTGRTVLDEDLGTTVVLAEAGRDHQVRFDLPLLPGPYRVEVVYGRDGDGASRTLAAGRATTWVWPPAALTLLAAVLLLVASGWLWRAGQRRRRARHAEPAGPS